MALEQQTNPVIPVGHSCGGTVFTEAANSPKVAALVCGRVRADRNESTNELQSLAQPPGYVELLSSESSGYLWFPQDDDRSGVFEFMPVVDEPEG